MAVMISTVSTVSEQERNGQGRRDVGKSVHVRQAIMQLDAYHVRRGFVQKTANKGVYNDGKRLLFAYPFLDVAALVDHLYISRSSAIRPTRSPQSSPPQCGHIILTIIFGLPLFLWHCTFPSSIHFFNGWFRLQVMDLLYISRSSAVRPTLHSQVHHNVTTSFSQYIWSSSVSLALYFSF